MLDQKIDFDIYYAFPLIFHDTRTQKEISESSAMVSTPGALGIATEFGFKSLLCFLRKYLSHTKTENEEIDLPLGSIHGETQPFEVALSSRVVKT